YSMRGGNPAATPPPPPVGAAILPTPTQHTQWGAPPPPPRRISHNIGFGIAHIGATTGLQPLLSTLQGRCCHRHMQDSLPAGWLAFAGWELNPLVRNERSG